eukprot:978185_1
MSPFFVLLASFILTVFAGIKTKTTTATPDLSSDDLEITLYGDIVSVVDGKWEIATPSRSQYDEWDKVAFNEKETQAYKDTQKGMHITVKINDNFGFEENQITNITIQIEGEIHQDFDEDAEIIIAVANTDKTKYFTSIYDLIGGGWYTTTVYPECGNDLIQGDAFEDADGTDFRWYTVGCPTVDPYDRFSDDKCDEIADWSHGFPVIAKIINDPGNNKVNFMYFNNKYDVNNSDLCTYNSAFKGDKGFMFYMAGEGGDEPEKIYISSVTVIKTTDEANVGVIAWYNGFIMIAS